MKIQIYLCLLQKLLDSFVQREYPGLAMKMKISQLNLGGGRGEAIARVKYRICSVGVQDRLPEKRENFSIITLGLFFFPVYSHSARNRDNISQLDLFSWIFLNTTKLFGIFCICEPFLHL